MRAVRYACAFTMAWAIAACGQQEPTALTDRDTPEIMLGDPGGGAVARVTGSGHVLRTAAGVSDVATFTFSAIHHADGTGSGQFQHNLTVVDVKFHGHVTCVTVAGNRGWIGGVIDRLESPDPADQSFVGTDVWWLVEDNGEGPNDPPDRTTSLLLTLPGTTITAASWCRDQPVPPVLLRPLVSGNIQVRN